VRGALNVLEAARPQRTPVIFASTNKVYGDLADVPLELVDNAYRPRDPALRAQGVSELRPLDFHTPYGCSKGAADQYVLDYARSFDVPTCVLRMSCIYGPHQMGTEDQGWVAHFLIRALNNKPISIYGDGRQVRDILYVDDAVQAYVHAFRRIGDVSGRAFNLGGGPANAVSLLQLLHYIEEIAGHCIDIEFSDWRAGDQRYYVSNPSAAKRELGLSTPLSWRMGVASLADWLAGEHAEAAPRRRTMAAAS
jgi:CDP-paratose 2-epimerase